MEKTFSVPVNIHSSFTVTVTMEIESDWDEDDIMSELMNMVDADIDSMEMADGQYHIDCGEYEFEGTGSYADILYDEIVVK